jgi:hypothetical protein
MRHSNSNGCNCGKMGGFIKRRDDVDELDSRIDEHDQHLNRQAAYT